MAGQSSEMLGRSWTDLSVLGSQVFGQASAESYVGWSHVLSNIPSFYVIGKL